MKLELASKALTLLTSRVDDADARAPGTSIDYANDPDIAPDGKVYFSDSAHGVFPVSNRFGFYDTMQAYMLTMFQARRLCELLPGRLASPAAVRSWLTCPSPLRHSDQVDRWIHWSTRCRVLQGLHAGHFWLEST